MADAVYESFDTREGFQAAVERLLERPGRELRIFDPDGAALRLNDAARVARLEGSCARAARGASTWWCTSPSIFSASARA
jgi:hypothetical protein